MFLIQFFYTSFTQNMHFKCRPHSRSQMYGGRFLQQFHQTHLSGWLVVV